MPKARANDSRRARGARRVRTDGAPRLVEPTAERPVYYIAWTDPGLPPRSKRKSTGTADRVAAEALLAQFNNRRTRVEAVTTIGECLDLYAEAKAKQRRQKYPDRALSLDRRTQSLLKPVRQHFAAVRADRLEAGYVDQYVTQRSVTVSPRTISIELAALRAALNLAKKRGRIAVAPPIELPQPTAKARLRSLKRAEFARLITALHHHDTALHIRSAVFLALSTGQRIGHILNLRWEHVDFDEGVIYFTAANPHAAENKRVADKAMTPRLAADLTALSDWRQSDWVIEHNGRRVASIKTGWRALLRRAGLQDVRIHDLRRTAATVAKRAGVSDGQIADFISDSEAVVRRHYAHAGPDGSIAVTRAIESAIYGSEP